jgi:hypothetical protein
MLHSNENPPRCRAVNYSVMPLPDSTSIAGQHTVKQWKTLKAQLDSNPRTIQKHLPNDLGEGFAIAALFCSLVEFLESTEQGPKIRPRQGEPRQLRIP